MRVLNIVVSGVYTDGLSYHENILPKYHKKNGNDVWVMASEYIFDENGEYRKTDGPSEYINEDGVHIIRLPIKHDRDISFKVKKFIGFYETIERIQPDIIFCHLFQFVDSLKVVKYIKHHPNVKLYVDNHSDFSNSATNFASKHILHGILWRYCAHKLNQYAIRFYGVLPARVDFLKNVYHLPEEKIELLVMGGDDEQIKRVSNPAIKDSIRQKLGFKNDDFIIVNGGKIDAWKKQTLLLMDAVNRFEDPKVKLLIFGSIVPELQGEISKRCSDRVKYVGWATTTESYDYFASGDVACFPGRHSVYWEQVAGQGIPLIVKKWDGTTHVNVCENTVFLEQDSVEEITKAIVKVKENYLFYKENAQKAAEKFLYSKIAKKAINNEK